MNYRGRLQSYNKRQSLITNALHLTPWTIEAEDEVSINANNFHLTQWTMEADY